MKLAALFSDHAVVQRGRTVPVWGWTRPLLRVRVELGAYSAESQAGADGRFLVRLPPMPAGGPFTLHARTPDPNECATATDVWVGEVWVCSGQSNMEWPQSLTGKDGERDAARADFPRLRMLTVPRQALAGRQSDIQADWRVCTPESVGAFSAVGYYFGLKLHDALEVAVGLLNTSWGGTRIETWISRETLMEHPDTRLEVEHYEATVHSPSHWDVFHPFDRADPSATRLVPATYSYPPDPGIPDAARDWARPDFDDGAWPDINLPGAWQSAGQAGNGVLWFRRALEVPTEWAGHDLLLGIGAVDKTDMTFFNGEPVGATGQGFDMSVWNVPRVYRVPGRLVQPGLNTIAVRAYSFVYNGGLIGPAKKMFTVPADDEAAPRLSLAGTWRYAVECDFGIVEPQLPPQGVGNPNSPYMLHDNMIAPLLPYAIGGALWYQGESNTGNAAAYGRLLAAMIRDWRHAWGQGDFPFLTVQLANYSTPRAFQADSTWALVREGQTRSLELPATGMAVAIDIGEELDIHPKNKRDVGFRLAQWALSRWYGLPGLVESGPLFTEATLVGDCIRLRFHCAGSGLESRDGALRTFVVAGEDRRFVPAEASIEAPAGPGRPADCILVRNPAVPRPMAVRYAWADNPDGANLYNAEGYPASPFRTDAW